MASLHRIRRALGRPIGATAVEYIIAIILVTLVVLATIRVFGTVVKERFEASSAHINKMEQTPQGSGKGATGASGSGGLGSDDKGGASASATSYKSEEERQQALLAKEEKKRQKAKFNPIIIVIFVGLVGLLIYVVMRGNSYS